MTEMIAKFFSAWGEENADTRANMLGQTLSDTFLYADPRAPEPITDAEALIAYVAMYTQYAPGASATAEVTSETKGYFRTTVGFEMADGQKQYGQYFIEVDGDGKLSKLIGFVGRGEAE